AGPIRMPVVGGVSVGADSVRIVRVSIPGSDPSSELTCEVSASKVGVGHVGESWRQIDDLLSVRLGSWNDVEWDGVLSDTIIDLEAVYPGAHPVRHVD